MRNENANLRHAVLGALLLAGGALSGHAVAQQQPGTTSQPAPPRGAGPSAATKPMQDPSPGAAPDAQPKSARSDDGRATGSENSATSPDGSGKGARQGTDPAATGREESARGVPVTWVESFWVLTPIAIDEQDMRAANGRSAGCWVKLYSQDDFKGRYITVMGPSDVPDLRSPYGTGLDNWESAVVGSKATVTTYDDQNFRARDAVLRAGQRYARLDDTKLGLFEDIESLRVRCAGQRDQHGSGGTTPASQPSSTHTAEADESSS